MPLPHTSFLTNTNALGQLNSKQLYSRLPATIGGEHKQLWGNFRVAELVYWT